jgi:hypothetical protein
MKAKGNVQIVLHDHVRTSSYKGLSALPARRLRLPKRPSTGTHALSRDQQAISGNRRKSRRAALLTASVTAFRPKALFQWLKSLRFGAWEDQTFLEAQRDFAGFHGTSHEALLAWMQRLLLNNLANLRRDYRRNKRQVTREVALPAGDSSRQEGGLRAGTPRPTWPKCVTNKPKPSSGPRHGCPRIIARGR